MKCKKCGFENEEDSSFCINCGSPIEKTVYKKCIVCGSDIEEDALSCTKCGSVQDDYIKCKSCGKACLKTTKFCTSCGSPLYDDNISDINNIQNILDQKDVTSSLNEENKPIFEETVTQPVNTEPIVNVPNFDEHNTTSTNNKPIIDNTEVYYTNSFQKPKKSKGKIAIIILSIVLGVCLLVAVGIVVYILLFAKKEKPISKENIVVQQKIDEDLKEESASQDENENIESNNNTEIKEEKPVQVEEDLETYYNIYFKDIVRIRNDHSKDAKQVGKMNTESELIAFDSYYNENDGFTWYKIGYNEWIASDKDWTDIFEFKMKKCELSSSNRNTYRVINDARIYSSPSFSSEQVGFLSKTSQILGTKISAEDNTSWIEITPCEYINAGDVKVE